MRLFIFFYLSLFTTLAVAQGKMVRSKYHEADLAFDQSDYVSAGSKYKKIATKFPADRYARYRYAECLRYTYQFEEAETIYAQLLSEDKDDIPLTRFYYALTLKAQQNWDDAAQEFREFLQEFQATDLESELVKRMAELELKSCPPKTIHNQASTTAISADIHSYPFPSYLSWNPADQKLHVYNTSRYHHQTEIFLLQNFQQQASGFSEIKVTKPVLPLEQEPRYFYLHKKKYLTHSAPSSADPAKAYLVKKISVSNWIDSSQNWSEPVLLNAQINYPNSDNGFPFVSADGKRMYFVSNREGSKGSTDIWYSESQGDDNWSEAICLPFNTELTESHPSFIEIGECGYLIFSSNGLEHGKGGMDLYLATDTSNYDFTKPLNGINQSGNDYQLLICGNLAVFYRGNSLHYSPIDKQKFPAFLLSE
ncbi:MAG: tetratricopeptide repeat protein [Cytophagaceae bacterium]|jgi:tetratricopeptide (TPR) repeat protein|nr:tetratricopeptide repeat protein [Cytophagaceae bacterium]